MEKIVFFDTTLRDGEQSPGATMNEAEKVRIARQLEKLGVDVIEAGFPIASEGDFQAVKAIANALEKPQVAGLARTSKEDIDAAYGAVKDAKNPRLHVFIATSDIHLEYKLKKTREEVLRLAVEHVKYASSLTPNVEFSAEDASRSDRDFLCKVFEAAIEAGATTINIPDTVGYATPEEFGDLVRYVKEHVPNINKAILSVHCHNDLGLATANTLSAIMNGARQVEVTINGIGERAGNASLEEVAMALYTRKDFFNFDIGINTKEIYPSSRLVVFITGLTVQPNKAIVGANAFAHESGIHQDGVLKYQLTYEIMKPETVGLKKSQLVLGKHSGRHAFKEKLRDLGYEFNQEQFERLFKRFKDLADKRKGVTDEDIEVLVAEEIFRIPHTYKLKYLNVVSGTVSVPTATVQLEVEDETVQRAGFGVGPIDAAYNAIAQITGTKARLLEFKVNSITGGLDAQGEVSVRLQENGRVVLGKGVDPDIIVASAKAYVDGLNRLEYLKKNPAISPYTRIEEGIA